MTLQIRDQQTVTSDMVAQVIKLMPALTDYAPGSITRTLIETMAGEVQRSQFQAFTNTLEGITVGTYRNFQFNQLAAVPTSGLCTFTRTTSTGTLTVSAGHRVSVPGSTERLYETTQAGTFAVGSLTVSIPVRALTAGTAGNTAATTITVNVSTPPGDMNAVTNPNAFFNGLEEETDEARFGRFQQFIAGLSGGTKIAIEAAARGVQLLDSNGQVTERVTGVLVHEPFLELLPYLGRVELYVDNGSGTASATLLAEVVKAVAGYTNESGAKIEGEIAAGIQLVVFAVTASALAVSVSVTVGQGFTLTDVGTAVSTAITNYITGLQVFQDAVVAEITAAAMGVPGVQDVAVSVPLTNVSGITNQRITPGTIEVVTVQGA